MVNILFKLMLILLSNKHLFYELLIKIEKN